MSTSLTELFSISSPPPPLPSTPPADDLLDEEALFLSPGASPIRSRAVPSAPPPRSSLAGLARNGPHADPSSRSIYQLEDDDDYDYDAPLPELPPELPLPGTRRMAIDSSEKYPLPGGSSSRVVNFERYDPLGGADGAGDEEGEKAEKKKRVFAKVDEDRCVLPLTPDTPTTSTASRTHAALTF
jgi:hypothetical protein